MRKSVMLGLILLGIIAAFLVFKPMAIYSGPVDLRVSNLQAYVSGYTVNAEFDVRNWGASMPLNDGWLIEMQPRPQGMLPLGVYDYYQNIACDDNHPENVHTVYNLQAGEQAHFKLTASRPVGVYDVYLCSANVCWAMSRDGNNGNTFFPELIRTPPYSTCQKVGTVTVTDPIICIPNWQCGVWQICGSWGYRERTCTDQNACGVLNGKPSEREYCTSTTVYGQTTTTSIGGSGGLSQNAILGLALIAGAGVFWFVLKKK